MSNRQLEEQAEANSDLQIASALGLSIDEFYQLDCEISTNESDDGLIYEYVINFQESSPKEILEKIEGLSFENQVYLQPYELETDPYDDELNWDISSSEQLDNLLSNLESAKKLLETVASSKDQFHFLVMLHAHIVASVEAFLSSTFIHTVTNSEQLIRKVVEAEPHFNEQKISFSNIYKKHEDIQNIVGDYLKGLIFHKIKMVRRLYKSILNIELGNISWLSGAIITRHHCTHRAGYDEQGNKVVLTVESTMKLINESIELGVEINSKATLIDKL